MIPESREVYEHGNREFDRIDEKFNRAIIFLLGMIAGATLMFLLGMIL